MLRFKSKNHFYLPILLSFLLIGMIGCSADNPTGPPEDSVPIFIEDENGKSSRQKITKMDDEGQVRAATILAPSNLEAVVLINFPDISLPNTTINLSWLDNSQNESFFRVQRKTGINGSWKVISTVVAEVTTYRDLDLETSQTYYYRVRAIDGTLRSDYSNDAIATTGDKIPLTKPTN